MGIKTGSGMHHRQGVKIQGSGLLPQYAMNFLTGSLDPSLTYTSGGNRMLYNSAGLLQWAPANMLLNSATLGTQSVTAVSGYSYTLSFQGTGSVTGSGGWTGTLNGAGASNRVSVAFTASTTSVTFTVTGSVTSAQLEPTSYNSPLAYNATTASAYYGPRFDYNPSTLAINGLLLEQSSTNLQVRSNTFNDASWVGFGFTLTPNTTTSPDGTVNASSVSLGAGSYYFNNSFLPAAGPVTMSIWAKAQSGTQKFRLQAYNGTNYNSPDFTATSVWQRFTFTPTLTAVSTNFAIVNDSTNDATSLYIYQAQAEQLAFATSPIPTTTTILSRSAESLTNSSIPWFNATQGTMFVESMVPATGGLLSGTIWPLASIYTSATNNITLATDGYHSGYTALQIYQSGSQTELLDTTYIPSSGMAFKIGGSYSATASAVVTNGGTVATSGAVGLPTGLTTLGFTLNNIGQQWLRNFSYYNTQLTNTQLQNISGAL